MMGSESVMIELLTESINLLNNQIIPRGSETWRLIEYAFNIMRIAVPILIVVLSTVDFVIAIASDEEKMKKATNKFIKRLVFGALFYLIPAILDLLFSLTGSDGIGQSGL